MDAFAYIYTTVNLDELASSRDICYTISILFISTMYEDCADWYDLDYETGDDLDESTQSYTQDLDLDEEYNSRRDNNQDF